MIDILPDRDGWCYVMLEKDSFTADHKNGKDYTLSLDSNNVGRLPLLRDELKNYKFSINGINVSEMVRQVSFTDNGCFEYMSFYFERSKTEIKLGVEEQIEKNREGQRNFEDIRHLYGFSDSCK